MRSLILLVAFLATVSFAQHQHHQQQVLHQDKDHASSHDSPSLRIFKPTSEFQPVGDNESLPPGLHIRLNLETGRKEARLNIPSSSSDEDVENGVIVIPNPNEPSDENTGQENIKGRISMLEKSGKSPPAYSNTGKILPPVGRAGMDTFKDNVAMVISRDESLSSSSSSSPPPCSCGGDIILEEVLYDLEDLSHDIYYGFEIARDARLTSSLLRILNNADEQPQRISTMPALILGGAVQNSPASLNELRNSHPGLMVDVLSWLEKEWMFKIRGRLIFLLANLVKNADYMNDFLNEKGMARLLGIYQTKDRTGTSSGSSRDGVRRKCVHFVTDHFLDFEMMGRDDDIVVENEDHRDAVSRASVEKINLRAWCEAFEMDLKMMHPSHPNRESIEAALRFPACKELKSSTRSTWTRGTILDYGHKLLSSFSRLPRHVEG
ncbi:MAG: hypothetical protein M1823_004063 [Watsoniomyces obsoletus]|nr:MAG: hypothetical protein M1823_004063 [Watsoniomyces obsoletus]